MQFRRVLRNRHAQLVAIRGSMCTGLMGPEVRLQRQAGLLPNPGINALSVPQLRFRGFEGFFFSARVSGGYRGLGFRGLCLLCVPGGPGGGGRGGGGGAGGGGGGGGGVGLDNRSKLDLSEPAQNAQVLTHSGNPHHHVITSSKTLPQQVRGIIPGYFPSISCIRHARGFAWTWQEKAS